MASRQAKGKIAQNRREAPAGTKWPRPGAAHTPALELRLTHEVIVESALRLARYQRRPRLRAPEAASYVTAGDSPPGRTQKIPQASSFRLWLSSGLSATMRFTHVFSFSSLGSRFACSAFIPPYWFCQRWKVVSFTLLRVRSLADARRTVSIPAELRYVFRQIGSRPVLRYGLPVSIGFCLLLAGCAPDRADAVLEVVSHDSAGTVVIDLQGMIDMSDPELTRSTTRTLQLGVVQGADALQFSRITGVQKLSDGRIVVGEGGLRQIRIYSPQGKHLQTIGRHGEGPGEFRSLSWVQVVAGDTILAWDGTLDRTTVYAPSGEMARVVSTGGGSMAAVEAFDDGTFLGVRYRRAPGLPVPGTDRVPEDLIHILPTGAVLNAITTLRGVEAFIHTESGGGVASVLMPFGRRSEYAVGGDIVLSGNTDERQVTVHGKDGSLKRIIRWEWKEPAITQDVFAEYVAEVVSRIESEASRARAMRMYAEIPRHQSYPAFSALAMDSERNIWIKYPMAIEGTGRWVILGEDGGFRGVVAIPEPFVPTWIGNGLILGHTHDEMDVPMVVMYALEG